MRSFSLTRRNISANPLRSLLTASAIALGIAMLLAASILMGATTRSANQLAAQESAMDLQFFRRDDGYFDADLGEKIAALPGVEQVASSLNLQVVPQGLRLEALSLKGVEAAYAELHALELANGAFLDRPDSVVLPMEIALREGLTVGEVLVVSLEGRAVELTVTGRLKMDSSTATFAAGGGLVPYVPLETAQALAGASGLVSQVDIGLAGRADLNQVRAEIMRLAGEDFAVVQTRAPSSFSVMDVLVQGLLGMVGVMILFASAFVIFNAFAMAVAGRRREIGALRCLGMTRRQVFANTLAEAAQLALVGALAGILTGVLLGWIIQQVMGTLEQIPFAVPWWGLVFSPLIGLFTTLAGAVGPAWQAQRVSPLTALRGEAGPAPGAASRKRVRLGWILLVLTVLGLAVFGLGLRPDLILGSMGLSIGMVFIVLCTVIVLPGLMTPLARLFRPLALRRLGASGRLAVDGVSRNLGRSAATTAGLAIGPAIVIFMTGVMSLLFANFFTDMSSMVHEDATIGQDLAAAMQSGQLDVDNFVAYMFNQQPIDPQLVAEVEALAAREDVELVRYALVRVPEGGLPPMNATSAADLEMYTRIDNFDYFAGDRKFTLEQMQRGPVILLTPGDAERLGVGLGERIPLQTNEGEVDFIVGGIGGNNLYMPFIEFADAQRYFDLKGPISIGFILPPGADEERVFSELEALLEGYPTLALSRDLDAAVEAAGDMLGTFEALLDGLMLLAVVVASLGVINTITINISERGRELGMLRAVGATRRQVLQSVVGEAAILGLAAAVLAAGLGTLLVGAFTLVATPNGYYSMGVIFQWDTLPPTLGKMSVVIMLSLVTTPLVAALTAYPPARSAAHLDVIEATRSERLSLKALTARRAEPRPIQRLPRSAAWTLAWRNLAQERTRTTLCLLAVALGVSMILATRMIGGSLLALLEQSEMGRIYGQGLFESFEGLLSLVGVGIMAAAGVLVFNAFAMGIMRRQQEIGALRALGGTRRQVLSVVLLEALITACGGVIVGLLLGPLLGRGAIALLEQADLILSGFGETDLSAGSLLLAVATGLGITLLAVILPARRAARLSPLQALRTPEPSSVSYQGKGPALVGLALVVLLFVFLTLAPPGEWAPSPWNLYLTGAGLLLWFICLGLLLPGLVGWFGRAVRRPSLRILGISGRLAADNLQRGRGRVVLTVTSLGLGVALITCMSGAMFFILDELFGQTLAAFSSRQGVVLTQIDPAGGTAAFAGSGSQLLDPQFVQDVTLTIGHDAVILPFYFVIVPEVSAMGSSYFSFVLDVEMLQQTGPVFFNFQQGDWESALPLMQAGCAVLVTPGVAAKNNAGLGESFTVQTQVGPLNCTVAGIGSSLVNASIISGAVADRFVQGDPTSLYLLPKAGNSLDDLEAQIAPLVAQYGVVTFRTDEFVNLEKLAMRQVRGLLSALLLAAVAAGALGVVNTSVISVNERRRELGLLRAVGSQRRQVGWMVAGEAALMGVLGGFLGLVAGLGFTLILVLTFGGKSWGLENLDLWPSAWRSVQPALLNGLLGLGAAPFISALAAWLPARGILRATPVEVLRDEYQPRALQRVAGILRYGSLRLRFMVGVGLLVAPLLLGLLTVVVNHAALRMEQNMEDTLRTMIHWNAGLLEANLPADAQNLELAQPDLPLGEGGFSFDEGKLLDFQVVIDQMSENGLAEFTIADVDGVVLLSLDRGQIGSMVPALEDTSQARVTTQRQEGAWLMQASAPVHNRQEQAVGSVRMTAEVREIPDFLEELRMAILAASAGGLALCLLVAWWISAPLVDGTRRLTAHARGITQGIYEPFASGGRRPGRFSLQTRLTAALVVVLILTILLVELVTLPIERRYLENALENELLAGTEWIGEMASDVFDQGQYADLFPGQVEQAEAPQRLYLGLEDYLDQTDLFALENLQLLNSQMRGGDLAYIALVDNNGDILLSDHAALIGERASVPVDTRLEKTTWQGDVVWVASTPLRRGTDGEQLGALRLAVRFNRVQDFLDESRDLFRLAGVIAALAGILLAQMIGGAVAAPVRHLAAEMRRVAQGDLSVRFGAEFSGAVGSRDELAILAAAYNEMVASLREREWLRDMFGRFVSREVAEAIHRGQVRLEGENRVVSVLFCDIRGFTQRSEKYPPEQIVALLNEYLPIVVQAATAHQGTVNKFGGDSTLVIYGAPRLLQESAYQAVLTALDMRAGLQTLNERLTRREEDPIRIGVGINTGIALAGAVGPKERQEYTVIGDTVNLASRIEGLNKVYPDYDILISQYTYEALGSRRSEFEFVDLGDTQISGKEQPTQVWAVVGKARR